MSFSTILTTVTYGVLGFIVGGPSGAVIGAAIGLGSGLLMDALAPDQPSPGQPQIAELAFPSNKEGINIPDALGTTKASGNIFQYFGNRSVAQTVTQSSGGKGGNDQATTTTTGYEYYLSWAMGICLGKVDYLYAVYAGDNLVWGGSLACPDEGGEETIELTNGDYTYQDVDITGVFVLLCSEKIHAGPAGTNYQYVFETNTNPFAKFDDADNRTLVSATLSVDGISTVNISAHSWNSTFNQCLIVTDSALGTTVCNNNYIVSMVGTESVSVISNPRSMGSMTFYFGTGDQEINSSMKANIANTPAYRHLCYAFFDDNYIGTYNRMPPMRFVFGKYPEKAFNVNKKIQTYDYNPAHAIWHILTDRFHANLPEIYMDTVTFSSEANILYTESRGVSILFDRQQTAKTYISTILDHIGGLIKYSNDSNLTGES